MSQTQVNVLLDRLARIGPVVGVEEELESLTRNLEAVQGMLGVEIGRHWLSELEEVCGYMNTVLDEWLTGENEGAKKKVCSPFPSSRFCSGKDNKLRHRRFFAFRIKMLNERLALVEEEKQAFRSRVPGLPKRPKTSYFPNVKTFGRDNEKALLVSKLLSESSEVPLVIPIVGVGGLGKTYLANLVYSDVAVRSHFDKRIWVSVSDPFEEIKIAKAIIEALDKDDTSNKLQTSFMQCVGELLEGKKFLLVLDDVCNPSPSQWEELIRPLGSGARGSKVMLTTQNEGIADLMGATTQLILLKELDAKLCLSFFFYTARIDESSVSKEIYDTGSEIVKMCNGLPLAVKELGSLLHKKNIHEWQAVLESMTWILKENQDPVFRQLLLSYHDLPQEIKPCLSYSVTFPKYHIFDRDNLIQLWMAQDYLNGSEKKTEINGLQYFDDLVQRSFYQDKVVDTYDKVSCKMNGIVHDFLQYLMKSEGMILDFEQDAGEILKVPDDKLRHLTVLHASKSDCLQYLCNCKNLWTFAAFDSYIDSFGEEFILQIRTLRTLNLRKNSIREVAREIGRLVYLRYLDLSDNADLNELPDTMSNLSNLQTLRLANCFGLKTTIDLGRLINLRHLYVDGCKGLKLRGIERAPNLQTLDTFYVHQADEFEDTGRNRLEELTNLNQLQGRLTIKNVRHGSSSEEAIMVKKEHLGHLVLEFRNNYPEQLATPENDREILDGLQPHEALKSLVISGYSGTTLSTWFSSLHSLKRLTLECCYDCEFFPTLGTLPSLESLCMKSFYVIKVGVEFLGIDESKKQTSSTIISFDSFPKLRELSIDYMLFWEEWEGVEACREEEGSENIKIMPCLSSLDISNCNHLKALPDFLWKTPLQKLHITGSSVLENLYREGTGENWAKISHIPSTNLRNDCIKQQKAEDKQKAVLFHPRPHDWKVSTSLGKQAQM